MADNAAIPLIGAIGGALLFFLAWRRPPLALTVWVIASTVFSEWIVLPDAPTLHIHLSRILLIALPLGLAGGWIPQRRRPADTANPVVLIAALTVWTIISACWTGTIFRVDGTKNLSIFLSGFLVPGMILFLARSLPLSVKSSRTICALFSLLLGYMVFTAFCEHFHLDSLIFPHYILDPSLGIHTERARGSVVNAAENGGIIAVLLLAGMHSVCYGFTGVMRLAGCLSMLLLGILALWFTETRGPWLAFAGGLLVMLWHRRCRGLVLALGGACAVVLTTFIIYSAVSVGDLAHKDPLPQRSDNTSDTAEFRMDLYRESVRPFRDHPLVGWGLGTFTDTDYLFDAYGGSLTIKTAVLHDTVVAVTLESGLIGGILYLSFLIRVSASLLRFRRTSVSPESRDFCTLCLASLAAFIISGLFVDIRYFMPHNALVFLMCGLGLSLAQNDQPAIETYVAGRAVPKEIVPLPLQSCRNGS